MQNLLNQFKALTADEKLAFMKEAMSDMAEIFKNDPQKMMAEMMPVCLKRKEKKMELKVLDPECPKCCAAEEVVKEAVAEAGVSADVEKVMDMRKMAGYRVFGTPAVVVDGEVKLVGKVPKKKEVMAWLK